MPISISQQQELRTVSLEFLVVRYPLAYQADAIQRMLARRKVVDFHFDVSDLVAAMTLLSEEGFLHKALDPLEVIPAWEATAKGVTHWQRRAVHENPEEGVCK